MTMTAARTGAMGPSGERAESEEEVEERESEGTSALVPGKPGEKSDGEGGSERHISGGGVSERDDAGAAGDDEGGVDFGGGLRAGGRSFFCGEGKSKWRQLKGRRRGLPGKRAACSAPQSGAEKSVRPTRPSGAGGSGWPA